MLAMVLIFILPELCATVPPTSPWLCTTRASFARPAAKVAFSACRRTLGTTVMMMMMMVVVVGAAVLGVGVVLMIMIIIIIMMMMMMEAVEMLMTVIKMNSVPRSRAKLL